VITLAGASISVHIHHHHKYVDISATRREGPQKPFSRLSEGDLCIMLYVDFRESPFHALG
jgi:hypothetical protein